MAGPYDDGRNPLIIPETSGRRRGCPKCGHPDYSGRRVMGVVTFRCKKVDCLHEWYGGLPQEPSDPRIPHPPINPTDRPTSDFLRDEKGEFREVRRRPNLTPEFKKGAPIPSGED
jgi:hypothetical protein